MKIFRLLIFSIAIIIGLLTSFLKEDYLIWALIIIGLCSPVIVLVRNFKRSDFLLSPIFWCFGSMFLWSITVLIDFKLGYEESLEYTIILKTAEVYALGNFSAVIAYIVCSKLLGNRTKSVEQKKPMAVGNILASSILVCIGMLMLLQKVISLGGIDALGIENRINMTQSGGSSGLNLPWHAPLNVGLVSLALILNKKKLNFLFVIIALLSAFLIFGFGARGDVLFVCLPAILTILFRKGFMEKKSNKAIIIISILLMLSPFFNVYRNMIIYDKSLADFEKWELAFNRAETGGAFRVTMDVISKENFMIWPTNTYGQEALSFLPSSIYHLIYNKEKFSSDRYFVENYYPIRAENGMSFGFSPIAESWINGGKIGVVFVFLILGIIIALCSKYGLPYVFLPSLMWFHRVSFDNFSSSIVFILVFLIILKILSILLSRRVLDMGKST